MSDLPLCQTCGGTGRLRRPDKFHGHVDYPCPAGCVAVMAWQCFKGYEPRCSEANQGAHSTGWGCGSHPTHLDPAKVILWCEMHGDVKHEGYAFCMGVKHTPSDPPCRIVVATYTIVGEPA